jgi:hypothetical protein
MKPYRNLHQGFAYPHLIALVKGIEPLRRPDISRLKYRGPFNHLFCTTSRRKLINYSKNIAKVKNRYAMFLRN